VSTIITLDVFSGRQNPDWQLNERQESELAERLSSARTITAQRPSSTFGGLGYRGFLISRSLDDLRGPLRITAHEGILDQGPGMPNLVDDAGLETWLVNTLATELPGTVREHILSQLSRPSAAPMFPLPKTAAVACPPNHAADAPTYNPGMWNTSATQPHNNCYNYANDRITNTFAQPGRATGHQATVMACPNVSAGVFFWHFAKRSRVVCGTGYLAKCRLSLVPSG
jgi:hypothetical protein